MGGQDATLQIETFTWQAAGRSWSGTGLARGNCRNSIRCWLIFDPEMRFVRLAGERSVAIISTPGRPRSLKQ